MGFTDDLLTGLALDLDSAGIGVYHLDGAAYTADQTGIVLGYFPDQPDNIISLTAYGVDDSPTLSDDTIGVQVKTRRAGAHPRPGMNLADQVFERWHSAHDVTLPAFGNTPPVFVKQMMRRSWVSGGVDMSRRSSMVQNFYVQLPRLIPNRP